MYHSRNIMRKMSLVVGVSAFAQALLAADAVTTRPARPDASTLVPVPQEKSKDIPSLRTREEVSALLGKSQSKGEWRPLHIVLVAGPKDHGPGEHDYPAWQKGWEKLLSGAAGTKVTLAWEKPAAEDLKSADVLVFFKHTAWPKEQNADIEAFLARGGGIVLLHFAVDCNANPQAGERQLGLYWGDKAKFRHGIVDLEFKDGKDPFLKGLAGKTVRFDDETYWNLTGQSSSLDVLATGMEDGVPAPVRIPLVWNRQLGKGRVHVNILGHNNWSFNDPVFRVIVLRGIAWAAGESVDRFNDQVLVDVKLKE